MADANIIAWGALLFFPLFALAVVAWARSRWPLARTATVLMVGAVMFLPSRLKIDLPLLPDFDKSAIASASVFFACWFFHRERVRAATLLRSPGILIGILWLSGIGTWLANTDVQVYGPTVVSGMSAHDSFQLAVDILVTAGFPVAVGRIAVRTADDVASMLKVLAGAGLVYAPLVLLEARISPQLHNWLYGFAPFDDWFQALRAGGFRPNVFMNHGLSVALFITVTSIASAALWKLDLRVLRIRPMVTTLGLLFVEIACRSLGALVYALTFLPMIALSRPKLQVQVACLLGVIALSYPVLRTTGLFPAEEIVELAAAYDEERAGSLEFRFVHEEALAIKALDRPTFGWGSYSRNHVFDYVTGEDLSVTDGTWVILLGQRGVFGWLCSFLLLLIPVFALRKRVEHLPRRTGVLLACLAVIVACHTVDLIPNSFSDTLPYFYAGALGSVLDALRARTRHRPRAPRRVTPVENAEAEAEEAPAFT